MISRSSRPARTQASRPHHRHNRILHTDVMQAFDCSGDGCPDPPRASCRTPHGTPRRKRDRWYSRPRPLPAPVRPLGRAGLRFRQPQLPPASGSSCRSRGGTAAPGCAARRRIRRQSLQPARVAPDRPAAPRSRAAAEDRAAPAPRTAGWRRGRSRAAPAPRRAHRSGFVPHHGGSQAARINSRSRGETASDGDCRPGRRAPHPRAGTAPASPRPRHARHMRQRAPASTRPVPGGTTKPRGVGGHPHGAGDGVAATGRADAECRGTLFGHRHSRGHSRPAAGRRILGGRGRRGRQMAGLETKLGRTSQDGQGRLTPNAQAGRGNARCRTPTPA